jgi:Tfp pilus assembly protein PilV
MIRRLFQHPAPRRRVRRGRRGGFTLIEAALTTVIVGTGVLAIVAAQQAYHQKNQWSKRAATGMLLANELRELMFSMPLHDPVTGDNTIGPESNESNPLFYDDVDDFTNAHIGQPTSGDNAQPLTGLGQRADSLPRWSQRVQVEAVPFRDLNGQAVDHSKGEMARVTVTVLYHGRHMDQPETVTKLTWIVTP